MRGAVAFAAEQEQGLAEEAAAANETWLVYPDDDPVRTVTSAADSRAALVPLLAHQVKCNTPGLACKPSANSPSCMQEMATKVGSPVRKC
jgi:hypothetical protein